jgi:hypothetical protein
LSFRAKSRNLLLINNERCLDPFDFAQGRLSSGMTKV